MAAYHINVPYLIICSYIGQDLDVATWLPAWFASQQYNSRLKRGHLISLVLPSVQLTPSASPPSRTTSATTNHTAVPSHDLSVHSPSLEPSLKGKTIATPQAVKSLSICRSSTLLMRCSMRQKRLNRSQLGHALARLKASLHTST